MSLKFAKCFFLLHEWRCVKKCPLEGYNTPVTLIVISNQSKGSVQSSRLVLRALNPEHFIETPVHSKEVVE